MGFEDLNDRRRQLVCVRHVAGVCRIPVGDLHGADRPSTTDGVRQGGFLYAAGNITYGGNNSLAFKQCERYLQGWSDG